MPDKRRRGEPPHWALSRATAGIAAIAAVIIAFSAAAQSPSWTAELAALAQPVSAVRQVDQTAFVWAGRWYRVATCGVAICFEPDAPPRARSARDGIPGGTIATAGGAGIVEAWYTEPTARYGHGILGDQIEGGGLIAVDSSGLRYSVTLDANHVFEDLTPRIADVDGDGSNEIVVVRSSLTSGAAMVVYGVSNGELIEIDGISEIGRSNRWLNVAGIADFDGDGQLDIALVKTPHIGGTLEFWTMRGERLMMLASAGGFSNHAIGSTELGLSAAADIDRDGVAELALPDDSRATLRMVELRGGAVRTVASAALGSLIVTAIAVVDIGGQAAFIAGLANGTLAVIRR